MLVTSLPNGVLALADLNGNTSEHGGGNRRWQLDGKQLTFITNWSRNTQLIVSLTDTELILKREHDEGVEHYIRRARAD